MLFTPGCECCQTVLSCGSGGIYTVPVEDITLTITDIPLGGGVVIAGRTCSGSSFTVNETYPMIYNPTLGGIGVPGWASGCVAYSMCAVSDPTFCPATWRKYSFQCGNMNSVSELFASSQANCLAGTLSANTGFQSINGAAYTPTPFFFQWFTYGNITPTTWTAEPNGRQVLLSLTP